MYAFQSKRKALSRSPVKAPLLGGQPHLSFPRVRPIDIQHIGNELAIKWDDGAESFIALEQLRRACPCAGCKGEMDVMGNLYKGPPATLRPESFQLVRLNPVGGYALQPAWADGHSTGLYSYDYLRAIAEGSGPA